MHEGYENVLDTPQRCVDQNVCVFVCVYGDLSLYVMVEIVAPLFRIRAISGSNLTPSLIVLLDIFHNITHFMLAQDHKLSHELRVMYFLKI